MKGSARLIDERERRESRHPLVGRQHVVDLAAKRRGARGGDRTAMELAVCQSRPMREQIAERDRARSGDRVLERAFGVLKYLQTFELRRNPSDWIVEVEPAFVEERQRSPDVTGLVSDAILKIVSRVTGRSLTTSRRPMASTRVDCPGRHTSVTAPASSPRKMCSCNVVSNSEGGWIVMVR